MYPQGWSDVVGKVDYVLSPYNCEDNGAGDGSEAVSTFPCTPGEHGGCFPQPTCDCYKGNAALSAKYGLPSAWADRTGMAYEGTHYIQNRGTAGGTDKHGHVTSWSGRAGAEAIVDVYIEY
mmetsp:Transcript_46551/g.109526  ORF Transcript_46551/g.109526 Transcript_46551/m.109526 type:complete len:121 (-) Transcript_46551:28-390(-)